MFVLFTSQHCQSAFLVLTVAVPGAIYSTDQERFSQMQISVGGLQAGELKGVCKTVAILQPVPQPVSQI